MGEKCEHIFNAGHICQYCGKTRTFIELVDLRAENAKLRDWDSRHKTEIHTLRQRITSLTLELESLRAALATTESMLVARIKSQCCGGQG